jgi:heme exporter protein D
MNWGSLSEFLAMGGHALYVWGSFGACLVALLVEPVLLGIRRHHIERDLARRARADKFDLENAT